MFFFSIYVYIVALKFVLKVENYKKMAVTFSFLCGKRKLLPLAEIVCTSLENCPVKPMEIGTFGMPKSSQELVLYTNTVSVLTITCSQIKCRLPMSFRRVSVCHAKYHNVGLDLCQVTVAQW